MNKLELITAAIEESNSNEIAKVSLQLEEILHKEMLTWPSYAKLSPQSQYSAIHARLERFKIFGTGDVKKLIDEVVWLRGQGYIQASGM